MPSTPEAVDVYLDHNVLFGPGKAANAGGVAVSGLEMCQNSMRLSWSREEVDSKLQGIMKSIHRSCLEASEAYNCKGNYLVGLISPVFSRSPKRCWLMGLFDRF